jgi:hypothetical protein
VTPSKRDVERRVDELKEDADDGTPDNLDEAIEEVKREERDDKNIIKHADEDLYPVLL